MAPTVWGSLIVFALMTQHMARSASVTGTSVDPPANIKVVDVGHLGYLTIEWSPPKSLENLTDCTVRYQFRYYDTYSQRWRSVRTIRLSYSAQFDLEKPVEVKMLTLLKGACTNGEEVLGEEVELVHIPEHIGLPGSRIRDFHCVYFKKEYMDCTWKSGTAEPSDSKRYIYYWHRELQQTEECPEYIPSSQDRKGCRFPGESLLEFSEFNICVNGSSAEGRLMPAFFSLEVQNHIKPEIVSNLELVLQDGMVQVNWALPVGSVPEQCLEYEIETTTESLDGSEWQEMNKTEETTWDFPWDNEIKRNCFRVRSKVSMYCADYGFWSDWSQSKCIPETKPEPKSYEPLWNYLALIGILAIAITAVLIFGLTLWMLKKMWMKRKEKEIIEKMNKAFPSFFNKCFPECLSPYWLHEVHTDECGPQI